MRRTQATAFTLCLLVAGTATAASDSLFTLGLGTAVGVNRSTPLHGTPEASFTTELSVKLKMLHVLGVEMSYAPTDSVADDAQLVFDATYRISGLLYIVPTYPVNFYLKGGLGGGQFTDMFKYDGETTSYHAGAGMDFHIGDNVVLGAEFLLLMPGLASVRNTLANYANTELQRYQAQSRDGTVQAAAPQLGVEDFISPENFRVALSARYYF